jgi:excisionase family DNA binding protein
MADRMRADQVCSEVVDGDPLLTVAQAAAVLCVSPWTIRMWLSRGRLKRTKVGSRTLIRTSQLKRMIQDQ